MTERGRSGHPQYQEGDKLYQCLHGSGRVSRMTAKMNHSSTGLKTCLENADAHMYRLYLVLERKQREGIIPSPFEIQVARGEKPISSLGYSLDDNASISQQFRELNVSHQASF